MDKTWMKPRNKFFLEYKEGVAQFLKVAKFHIDAYEWKDVDARDVWTQIETH